MRFLQRQQELLNPRRGVAWQKADRPRCVQWASGRAGVFLVSDSVNGSRPLGRAELLAQGRGDRLRQRTGVKMFNIASRRQSTDPPPLFPVLSLMQLFTFHTRILRNKLA